tara:strand:+ start:217 stop:882 length:666 start_codon:yes stop_codon:yes gene_type:complete
MKGELLIFGKIIKKYRISKKNIDDLNKVYERVKSHLNSYGPRLAGRLDSELDLVPVIEKTAVFKTLCDCMHDYIKEEIKYNLIRFPSSSAKTSNSKLDPRNGYNLNIIGCWMNDMVQGEYNPPHTHHDNTGYSVVLYLRVPEFINDAKDPHKFKDGFIGFTTVEGSATVWKEPKVGDFYIFHASHQHCVMPFKTKEPVDFRRSMSFNFTVDPPLQPDEKNE